MKKLTFGRASVVNALLGSLFLFCASHLTADTTTVNTAPDGFFELGAYDSGGNYLGLLANSDTLISIPFTRLPAFVGTVQSVSGNIVTVTGSPNWTANQFVYAAGTQTNTYYAQLGPNSGTPADPKDGCCYQVTANGTGTVTLYLNGDSLTSVPANSQITIFPAWTLNTLFPASNANVSFTPTTSRLFTTEVAIPDYTTAGINLSPSKLYYFVSVGSNIGWRLVGDANTTDHGNDPLVPDGYITVRNQNGAPTLPLVVSGCVPTSKLTVPLTTLSAGPQDNAVAIIRPVDSTLNTSGLNTTDGSFVATTGRNFADELCLYSNSQVALNKSPSSIYYYYNNGWRLVGDSPATDHGTDTISAGSALTIRKAATSSGQTVFWTNTPSYSTN
ncbi:MAG: TIGR02597 family protein [Methylacidiphilales bacterium]|nr:TIGR02597 family protein [Candidatus Methylacidiphilales bacterium]